MVTNDEEVDASQPLLSALASRRSDSIHASDVHSDNSKYVTVEESGTNYMRFESKPLPAVLTKLYNLEGLPLFIAVTTVTCLGFLLIGYDNGLMGGLVSTTAFNNSFQEPGSFIVGFIVAIYEVGCFLGAVFTAFYGDTMGRKRSIGLGALIMIIGALLQATAYSRSQLIIARLIAGLGMGLINSTVPVFQAEFSPKATRGLYVCMQLSTLNFGIALAYWIDFAFSYRDGSYAWRLPCAIQLVFLIPLLVILLLVPETPRWLASHDYADESFRVLRKLHGSHMSDAEIKALHTEIVSAVVSEKKMGKGKWTDLLRNDDIQSSKRLFLACAIQFMQQAGGINALVYYASTIFEQSVGLSNQLSAIMSGLLQTWFFIASFIPWLLIDRVGRRILFLSMISVMALVMAAQAYFIYQVQHKTYIAHAAGISAAAMLFIFETAFTIGNQATVWVVPTEILPLRLRQRGSSIATAGNWLCNYAIVQVTPVAIANLGYGTYIIFAFINAIWVPFIYFLLPETKGLELEEIDDLFARPSKRPAGSEHEQCHINRSRHSSVGAGLNSNESDQVQQLAAHIQHFVGAQ